MFFNEVKNVGKMLLPHVMLVSDNPLFVTVAINSQNSKRIFANIVAEYC